MILTLLFVLPVAPGKDRRHEAGGQVATEVFPPGDQARKPSTRQSLDANSVEAFFAALRPSLQAFCLIGGAIKYGARLAHARARRK
jgi:hypothetical protein